MAPRLLHYSDVENVYDTPERAGRLAGLLRALRADSPTDAILAGSGDDTSPGVLALVTEGAQALDFFRAVEPDVETFGNHEFDHGRAALGRLVDESPQRWVSANVWADREAGERFGSDVGVGPTAVVEAGDASVGFVGVTTARTPSINPAASDLDFTDPVAAARDALADLDADYRVVLSHLGRGDEELARAVDADVILGGHVPTERCERIDGTVLTRPGDGGSVVLEVDLDAGDDAHGVTRHPVADAPVHEGVAAAMRDRLAETGLNEVVGRVEPPIDRTETTLFGGECRLGNFVADAYRWETDAEVGLQNSGGVRTGDALDGEVTAADLVSVTPFDERVVVAEVPGDALRAAFEWAASPDLGFAEAGWWHAQVSGAEIAWDPDARTVESVRVGGEPLDPARTYSVALSDYVLHTDDEFPSLREAHRVAEAGIQYEVLVEYAREAGLAPELEGRIVEVE
ncbi:bifunctional metallophosphatase/5'-nucleotidase [Halorussus halobius]|uniref:bifunctional metallophosphatase/5'-nucleotidase n=1 Tax=Halorussus halobius TaxID=1710537 RepID=UPI001092D8D7|nr:bifunctional metallophosphatase/5'-nucleotidase [Halorussus halobius]